MKTSLSSLTLLMAALAWNALGENTHGNVVAVLRAKEAFPGEYDFARSVGAFVLG
jgi:hypothetical protein